MKQPTNRPVDTFEIVRTVGLTLPDVEATTKYDGSPVLKVDGIFMAGLATHPSAEPDTLVVRAGLKNAKGSWRMRPCSELAIVYARTALAVAQILEMDPAVCFDWNLCTTCLSFCSEEIRSLQTCIQTARQNREFFDALGNPVKEGAR